MESLSGININQKMKKKKLKEAEKYKISRQNDSKTI